MIATPAFGLNGLRLVLAGLALLIGVLLAARGPSERGPVGRPAALARILPDISVSLGGDARPAIERSFGRAPAYADVFRRMQAEFAPDYDRIMRGFVEHASAVGRIESVDYYLSEMIKGLRQRRGILASRAAPDYLARVFDVQLKILDALAADNPRLCVDFLYGAVSPGFYDFAAGHRAMVADMALAAMDAVENGRGRKIERRPPSNGDFDLLEKELTTRGLSREEIDALLDGRAPDRPLGDKRMCEAGRAYIRAMQDLPEGARARIHGLAVELMARS